MRRLFTILLFLVTSLIATTTQLVVLAHGNRLPEATFVTQRKKVEQTVYITRTGERYHRGGCRYLRQSKIPMKKSEAIASGYTPCKVCRP
jgi:hypothetical protein